MWWRDAVIYQVYLRSFQDSDGDGVGDLPGAIERLEHIAWLGAGAVWLSPVYPSPNADYGYDVSDFEAVEPSLGTLADLDALIGTAHGLGLKVILDFVPCHTSIEHLWFRERPEYYVWRDGVLNNWQGAFGGSVWACDPASGRYYLHSFLPEQADLDWHRPDVRRAMGDALAFWVKRGVDGFRLDALDRLMKDEQLRDEPPASAPPALPMSAEDAKLDHVYSRNGADVGVALDAIRGAVADRFLVGEVYLPTAELGPYLGALDAAFSFDALFAGGDADRLRAAIAAGLGQPKIGWVLSNHDFSRLATRAGPGNARACALLLLSLPGPAFMLAGDEVGMGNSQPTGEPLDRYGRDGYRMPMRWDDSPHAGFTTGTPWLATTGAQAPSVADQATDADSTLSLFRRTIALRASLGGPAALVESAPGTVVVARGDHLIAINLGDEPRSAPRTAREIVLEANPGDGDDPGAIPAHGGWIGRSPSIGR